MQRFWRAAILALTLLSMAPGRRAAADVVYSSYTLPFSQNVTLNVPNAVDNERGAAGQIWLHAGLGITKAWCIDIFHMLQGAGTLIAGTLNTAQAAKISALASHGDALLATSPTDTVSAAIQVAIWKVATGSGLTVSGNATMLALADSYTNNVNTGFWAADPGKALVVLAPLPGMSNQTLVTMVDVPEPAAAGLFAAGLGGLVLLRRRQAARSRGNSV
ncbi:MAG TPA: PEP-CTERM sorting domain-containing protein [Acetobacteraceae bacterium]